MFGGIKRYIVCALCVLVGSVGLAAAQQVVAIRNIRLQWEPGGWYIVNRGWLTANRLADLLARDPQNLLINIRNLIQAQYQAQLHPGAGQNLPNPEWTDLSEHVFLHGHAGRYGVEWGGILPGADDRVDQGRVRGMFNLSQTVQDAQGSGVHVPKYQPRNGGPYFPGQGVYLGPPSLDVASVDFGPINVMLDSFFQQPLLPPAPLRPLPSADFEVIGARISIYFSLPVGAQITNLNVPAGICSEWQDPRGWHPGAFTNRFCLVLDVRRGKITPVTLFPVG